ncbi:NAD(P)H-quinone oxidoreductase [Psychromicrobium xiongbiense]|uniref:NAD(P)H-quinone oxidoreductase n=1 Tax=Psychromicrobium xiongbiense TaxID=3051184 RepID=UPI00255248DF|nr:NAD(P)H-quinone oxidoreductase [Psychromicrobium sp. YIM S02556]
MRAVTIPQPGGPEALVLAEVPDPVPGPGEVLIDVVAAGLNRADVQQRRGYYPPPPGAPGYPGLEVSGRISAATAPEVLRAHGFTVGQPVLALLAGGGYAEKVAVPAGQVVPLPEGIDLVEAAGLPEVAATVYANLVMAARLRAGETLLVHGATGGIGSFAIQFGKAMGATVLATASGPEKCRDALALGANEAIDYRSEDFVLASQLRGGANVILDVVGGAYLERNLEALALGGRLVVIALQGGSTAELNLATLMGKRASIIGTTLRARPVEEKSQIMARLVSEVWPLVSSGAIRPMIDRTFPLDEVQAAHEYFDSGQHRGKVMLTMSARPD